MATFEMCADCRREYEDPTDRRFHAQPIACPACGPQLELLDTLGRNAGAGEEALRAAAAAVLAGQVRGRQGTGRFHCSSTRPMTTPCGACGIVNADTTSPWP